jgi:hypothetical protein
MAALQSWEITVLSRNANAQKVQANGDILQLCGRARRVRDRHRHFCERLAQITGAEFQPCSNTMLNSR